MKHTDQGCGSRNVLKLKIFLCYLQNKQIPVEPQFQGKRFAKKCLYFKLNGFATKMCKQP